MPAAPGLRPLDHEVHAAQEVLCCFPWLAGMERADPDRPAVGTSPLSPGCNASHRDCGTAGKIIRATGGKDIGKGRVASECPFLLALYAAN